MAQHPDGDKQSFLSVEEAKEYALKGFNKHKWGYPKELSQAIKDTIAAEPLLVERIDRKNSFYYIVPFNRNDKTALLIIIDAKTGAFGETTYLKEPASYPKIKKEDAKKILSSALNGKKAKEEIFQQDPTLVWKPSEQTQSPYEPLWQMRIGSKNWYIDQKGKVYDKVIEIKLKGGGI